MHRYRIFIFIIVMLGFSLVTFAITPYPLGKKLRDLFAHKIWIKNPGSFGSFHSLEHVRKDQWNSSVSVKTDRCKINADVQMKVKCPFWAHIPLVASQGACQYKTHVKITKPQCLEQISPQTKLDWLKTSRELDAIMGLTLIEAPCASGNCYFYLGEEITHIERNENSYNVSVPVCTTRSNKGTLKGALREGKCDFQIEFDPSKLVQSTFQITHVAFLANPE